MSDRAAGSPDLPAVLQVQMLRVRPGFVPGGHCVNLEHLRELLLVTLEHELGTLRVYHAALAAALDPALRADWDAQLDLTMVRVAWLQRVCLALDLDDALDSTCRRVARDLGTSLVEAIHRTGQAGRPAAAQSIACECLVLAHTANRLGWELLARCAPAVAGAAGERLREVCGSVVNEVNLLEHARAWSLRLHQVELQREDGGEPIFASRPSAAESGREDVLPLA